jgi:hypothetical protein
VFLLLSGVVAHGFAHDRVFDHIADLVHRRLVILEKWAIHGHANFNAEIVVAPRLFLVQRFPVGEFH